MKRPWWKPWWRPGTLSGARQVATPASLQPAVGGAVPPPRRALCETGNPGDHGALLRPDGTEHPARPGWWQFRAHVHSEPQAEDSQPTAVAGTAGAGCGRTRPKQRPVSALAFRLASASQGWDGVRNCGCLAAAVLPPALGESSRRLCSIQGFNHVHEESQGLPSVVGNKPTRMLREGEVTKGIRGKSSLPWGNAILQSSFKIANLAFWAIYVPETA